MSESREHDMSKVLMRMSTLNYCDHVIKNSPPRPIMRMRTMKLV